MHVALKMTVCPVRTIFAKKNDISVQGLHFFFTTQPNRSLSPPKITPTLIFCKLGSSIGHYSIWHLRNYISEIKSAEMYVRLCALFVVFEFRLQIYQKKYELACMQRYARASIMCCGPLSVCLCVCLSVCLSQARIVSKLLHRSSWGFVVHRSPSTNLTLRDRKIGYLQK